jgi:hypothetical protein
MLARLLKKGPRHGWPQMNADQRRFKRIGLSVFISVNLRLNIVFPDFFSILLQRSR